MTRLPLPVVMGAFVFGGVVFVAVYPGFGGLAATLVGAIAAATYAVAFVVDQHAEVGSAD